MSCCCGNCTSEYAYQGPSANELERAEARLRRIEKALGFPDPPEPKPAPSLSEYLKEAYRPITEALMKDAPAFMAGTKKPRGRK